jgi:hypothetical protein
MARWFSLVTGPECTLLAKGGERNKHKIYAQAKDYHHHFCNVGRSDASTRWATVR